VQVRRRRRRRSALRGATGAEDGASACGVPPTEEAAAAAAAMEATTCARHRRHATVSSASLRSPRGRRAIGRVGARRFDAAGVSNAAPTGTVARKRWRMARRCGRRHPSRTGGGDDGAIVSTRRAPPSSLHAPRALPSSPPRLVRVRNPQRLPARLRRAPQELRPPPTRPAAWEASVGGVRGFR